MKIDLTSLTSSEVLHLHAQLIEELRARKITRTSNNPTGDLAEYLFCKAFGWKQEPNSKSHVDAIDSDGLRYQIKARRITEHNNSRQVSAIRNLDDNHFDYLAGVLFTEDYKIYKAAIIPRSVIVEWSKYGKHTNSHRFLLHDDIWIIPSVRDVSNELSSILL